MNVWEDLCLALIGGAGTLVLFFLYNKLQGMHRDERFEPFYFIAVFPVILLLCTVLIPLLRPDLTERFLMNTVHVLLTTVLYTALLSTLIPLLRRRVSAKTCVALWFIPSVIVYGGKLFLSDSLHLTALWTVRLSASVLWWIFGIWAAGFLATFTWKLLSHVRFRRALLREASAASGHERSLYYEVREALYFSNRNVGRDLRIVRSPAASAPLSIGVTRRTACIVLPEREYSDEELRLIFRHETIHLLRADNVMKLLLTALCAAGWFIPTLWIGMGKAAEDMELCCDELATDLMDKGDRQAYAGLLLCTAGTAKGFTTCLSASASGLRYRLSRILHPQKRRTGYLAVVLLSALFFLCFARVEFRLDVGPFRDEILNRDDSWHVGYVALIDDEGDRRECRDPEAVDVWLRDLRLTRELGQVKQYRGYGLGTVFVRLYRGGDEPIRLAFYGNYMDYYEPGEEASVRYQLEEPIDLEWFQSMAVPGE